MTKPSIPQLTAQLMAAPFARNEASLPEPLVDTPLQVTLEQVRPLHLDPRRTPNPKYQQIKTSIRQRGLDQPPSITRRPHDAHFIIRNGGNTRLAILNELWQETGEERFHSFLCLYRPWTARAEILALAGHLAENDTRGDLTYIERSQAVDKARQLYQQECGRALTQCELAERLTEDGYPINQPAISRMGETLEYLWPAIPGVLQAGLGRPQIRRLLTLRKSGLSTWQRYAPDKPDDFAETFTRSLAGCDGELAQFSFERARDELIGNLAQQLDLDYDELALELGVEDLRKNVMSQILTPQVALPTRLQTFPTGVSPPVLAQDEPPAATSLHERIAQLARSITAKLAPGIEVTVQDNRVELTWHGEHPESLAHPLQPLLTLLKTLCSHPTDNPYAALLYGTAEAPPVLDDESLARLYRLVRLARAGASP